MWYHENSYRTLLPFLWITCFLTECFLQFLCHIFKVPSRKKSGKYVLGGFGRQYTIFTDVPIPFWEQHGTGKDAPQSASYGDMWHLWTCLGHTLDGATACLHHSSHGWYVTPVNDRATRSKSMLSLQRKQKKREPDDDSDPTQEVRREKHRQSGREGKHLGNLTPQGSVSPKIICNSGDSRGFHTHRERENASQKQASQVSLTLPWQKHGSGMMSTWTCGMFYIQIAHVGFVTTVLYYLHSELDIEFDFEWPSVIPAGDNFQLYLHFEDIGTSFTQWQDERT